MSAGTLVTIQEYLATVYEPDREYLDGVILERNAGEYDHAKLQTALAAWFFNRRKLWGIHPLTEQRVQVSASRFRVPDVCVVAGPEPREPILTQPPLLCIEILSREDRVLNMQEKISDYLAFGVRYVWIMNPQTLATMVYTPQGTHEAKDGVLRTENPEIVLPLAELFD